MAGRTPEAEAAHADQPVLLGPSISSAFDVGALVSVRTSLGPQVAVRASAHGGKEELEAAVAPLESWPERRKTSQCQAVEKQKQKHYVRFKFIASLMIIKRDYRRVGGTLFMTSYPEYLRVRDKVAGQQYHVCLAEDHDKWNTVVHAYIAALKALPCSAKWTGLHWVGSTACPGLVAKPIVDLMITTSEPVEEALLRIAEDSSIPEWRREKSGGLQFPIGFFGSQMGVDWGFLQMPTYHALLYQLVECNLHIFPDGEQVATEKITMRDFLNSDEGSELKQRYSLLKKDLEQNIKRGTLQSQDYNKHKHSLVQEILVAAEEWNSKGGTASTSTGGTASVSVGGTASVSAALTGVASMAVIKE